MARVYGKLYEVVSRAMPWRLFNLINNAFQWKPRGADAK